MEAKNRGILIILLFLLYQYTHASECYFYHTLSYNTIEVIEDKVYWVNQVVPSYGRASEAAGLKTCIFDL